MADKKVRYINLNNQILKLGGDGILSYTDIATMVAEPVSNLQDGAIAWVSATDQHKYYQYLSENELTDTGKWRELIIDPKIQIKEVPTPSSELNGAIIQYIGDTNTSYKRGYFYECVFANEGYAHATVTLDTRGDYYIKDADGNYNLIQLDGTNYDSSETYYQKVSAVSRWDEISTQSSLKIDDENVANYTVFSSDKVSKELDKKLDSTFTGADVANKFLYTDENGIITLKELETEGTAETTTYTNADYPDYTNVDLALDALFAKVYYVKPACSLSATPSGGTFEMGTTITAPITFTWTTNKDITSQTLTDCALADASVRTAIYNMNVTADKTFTLSVSDGENSASSSVSYKFLNKVYYGSASEPNSYDSAFILGLSNNKFATSIKGSYPITVESGQFGYIACPKSFNAPSECYIGGFLTTLENAGEISFTNASGGVAAYTILRTGKSGLGSLTMEFK